MAAGYTLFGSKGSGSAIVEAALALAGVAHRNVDAASWEPGPGRDELARVNPLCQIPTLVLPDGSVLTESAAILLHLGLAHPASALLPADPARRAQVLRGLVYIAANCYAAIGIIDYPERWCADADDDTNARIKAGSTARLHYLWDVFADQFPASPFLTGERLGALDLMAAVVSKWSGSRKHLAASRPRFSAVLATIESDPRVAPVFARHWPPAR
jgi:GST-like protein